MFSVAHTVFLQAVCFLRFVSLIKYLPNLVMMKKSNKTKTPTGAMHESPRGKVSRKSTSTAAPESTSSTPTIARIK